MEPKQVLVIGGGIAGMTAAWELAEAGVKVHLVEKSGFLGGHAIQYTCKAAAECLQCGACAVEKTLKNVVESGNIIVHLATEIDAVEKKERFAVTLTKAGLFIDPKKCTNCGLCHEKFKDTGAVERGFSKNNRPLFAIRPEKVNGNAAALKAACPEGAIVIGDAPTASAVTADAVVVATGFQTFDARLKGTYGYSRFPNVVNGLDLERIKRRYGYLARPSDGEPAKKIAFIQCVGSRDERLGNLWCSQVCCPYVLRTAASIKHKNPDLDLTIFYMDIQTIGKNFPVFYETCKNHIRFIRSIPVDVFPLENDSLNIRIFNEADGSPEMEAFDLLVLATGIMPNPDNPKLSAKLSVSLNSDGFFSHADDIDKTSTQADGVFIAGTAQGPKTIPSSMAQAGQAARQTLKYLGVTK